jgi:hypothetical protein
MRDLAWGCGFSALLTPPAVYSLALDEISVSSNLGQPLQAMIAVSASTREALESGCFSVARSAGASLPGIENVRVHFDRATGQLMLRSLAPVREPMSEVTVRVRCQGAPALDRTFLVVLDPPDVRGESTFARADATREPASATHADAALASAADIAATSSHPIGTREPPAAAAPRVADMPSRRSPRMAGSTPSVAITPGSDYVTQVGDTLSGIAERVTGRPTGSLWAFADRIHAQNPAAFVDGNADRLIAGVALAIPRIDALADRPVAPTTSFAHVVASSSRERDGARSRPDFVLSTVLSQDSRDKLQLRDATARAPTDARLASIPGTSVREQSPEPAAAGDAVPMAVQPATGEPEIASVASDDSLRPEADTDRHEEESAQPSDARAAVADGTAQVVASAPDAPREAVAATSTSADATASDTDPQAETATPRSSIRWALWVLGTLTVVGLLTGLLAGLYQLHRRAAARRHAQSQRRASGRERTIRLDHGIVVKEHPIGTPLTVDASTTEIAAIRLAQRGHMPADAQAEAFLVGAEAHPRMLDFATEALADPTLKMARSLAVLDLELPELAESASGDDAVPTEVIEPRAQHNPLADSRQFLVDTDLLAAAYTDDAAARAAELSRDGVVDLPLFPPMSQEASDRDDTADDAQASSFDDSALALWELKDDEDAGTMPNKAARARSTNKR